MDNIWITKAEYLHGYNLALSFSNGTSGQVDLTGFLEKPIFRPLKDLSYFKKFSLNSWTIHWENGADFAPEFLYDLVTK